MRPDEFFEQPLRVMPTFDWHQALNAVLDDPWFVVVLLVYCALAITVCRLLAKAGDKL